MEKADFTVNKETGRSEHINISNSMFFIIGLNNWLFYALRDSLYKCCFGKASF